MAFGVFENVLNQVATAGVLAPADEVAPTISVSNELNLHSLPGAKATLFLDFNGHLQRERVGMSAAADFFVPGDHGWENILTPAFDRDGNPLTFSPDEQEKIRFIWASVAEDYAPFHIDVTTVDPDPGLLHPERPYLRVIISGEQDFRGDGAGGFADYDAYAQDSQPNVAYVFDKASNGNSFSTRFIAEAVSHEAGHAFGLEHYSEETGGVSRAPIMKSNSAESALRGTWHRGANTGWPESQDDMAVIANSANGFGYRYDDHADGFVRAQQLTMTNDGLFGRGVIEQMSDVDVFKFHSGGGRATIDLNLPQAKVTPNGALRDIGNLFPTLKIFDAGGNLVAEDSQPGINAFLNAELPAAGTYFVQVGSRGDYGDVGQYTLQVTETSGPRVVGSESYSLRDNQVGILVNFDESINPYSFTAADVRINGGAPGAGVVSIGPPSQDWKSFLVTVNRPDTTSIFWTVTIGPNINDVFGNLMDQSGSGLLGQPEDAYTMRLLGNLAPSLAQSLEFTSVGGLGTFEPGLFDQIDLGVTRFRTTTNLQTLFNQSTTEAPAATGTVSVEVVSDQAKPGNRRLVITGDDGANEVAVELGANSNPNAVRVRTGGEGGLDQVFEGITHGVSIDLLGGDDVLAVTGGNMKGPVLLDAGLGDDTYVLSAAKTKLELRDSGGVDTLDFSNSSKGVAVNLAKQTGQSQNLGGGNSAKLFGQFENVVGSAFNDTITGNAANNVLRGLAGNDKLSGGGGDDILRGGEGDDNLSGNDGNDILLGDAGNDSQSAGLGFDILIGGLGFDKLTGGPKGNSLLIGGTTVFDSGEAALLSVLAEWASGAALATRVANLTNGGGLNGGVKLVSGDTVIDDLFADSLKGSFGANWYFLPATDKLSGKKSSDQVTI